MVEFKLRGFEEISRRLALLRVDVARSLLKSSLRRLAQYVADEVKRAAPVGRTTGKDGPRGGELRRAIGIASRAAYAKQQARMVVGIDFRAFYWKFIEFGTKAHTIKAGKGKTLFFSGIARSQVKHPGIPPRPFIRPTWDRIKTKLPKMFADDVLGLLRKHGLN